MNFGKVLRTPILQNASELNLEALVQISQPLTLKKSLHSTSFPKNLQNCSKQLFVRALLRNSLCKLVIIATEQYVKYMPRINQKRGISRPISNIYDGAFMENSQQLNAVKYSRKKVLSQMFDRVLNTPLFIINSAEQHHCTAQKWSIPVRNLKWLCCYSFL